MDRKALMAEWPKNGNDVSAAVQLLGYGYPEMYLFQKELS